MSTPAAHDPTAQRFIPDPELVSRAQRQMLAGESDRHRYLRQRWEEAFGAVRVAMDTLRLISPLDHDLLDDADATKLSDALDYVQAAYASLDALSPGILTKVAYGVITGQITSHERMDLMGVPR